MITLWGRKNSTNVKKVMWVLHELDLAFEQIQAGGQFGINDTADFKKMNPNGLVPLLRDDATDALLWESNTIVRYLAAQYAPNALWIDDPVARASAEKWMDWSSATLSPAHRVVLLAHIRTPAEQRDSAQIQAGQQALEAHFALLDDALAKHAWLGGEAFGLADISVAPFVYNLWNCGLEWQPRPNLQRWYDALTKRSGFQKVVMIPVT
ncbi:glutathione S-transferase family protein [Halomonas dongshanensis]|uniref:Glutathione S-transferase family protein n=1 Tax=Halomonas dongshanensis TaxID=2890835 RepID=A0ABT2EEX2_9GAMM|nr:glutathione S-transferase family protein [Halomonas dongshanensis]MCS2610136.1 glutathione S-transferase family protein [Halomonas dongshanensis]